MPSAITTATTPRLLIFSKNFAAPTISHIGLGVSSINTAKSLTAANYKAEVYQVRTAVEIRQRINLANSENPQFPVTHVVVCAPWVSAVDFANLTRMFHRIQFVCNCHSNVGFLQADANGVGLIRQYMYLE